MKKNKIKIYNSHVLSVLLHCAECWGVTQRDSERLSDFHTSFLRTIRRICWPQKITNKELYQRTRQNCIKVNTRWWKKEESCPLEARRRMIEAEMRTTGKTWKELEMTAKDREQWKFWSELYVPPRCKEDQIRLLTKRPPTKKLSLEYFKSTLNKKKECVWQIIPFLW